MKWAIAGPKGGSGKTLFAASVAHLMARKGERVKLFDRDGNLPTALGQNSVEAGENDPTHPPLVPFPLPEKQWLQTIQSHCDPSETCLIDLPAHLPPEGIKTFLAAEHRIVIITPDPLGIERFYAFLQSLYTSLIEKGLGKKQTTAARNAGLLEGEERDLIIRTGRIQAWLKERDSERAGVLENILDLKISLVVNMTHSQADLTLGPGIVEIVRAFYGFNLVYVGHIPYDKRVAMAGLKRLPFITEYPTAEVAACYDIVLTAIRTNDPPPGPVNGELKLGWS